MSGRSNRNVHGTRRRRRAYDDPRYKAAVRRLKAHAQTCWICHRSIDPSLRWPHPLSFSADHVIAKSRLTIDDPRNWEDSNLRPAHLRCNQSRGAGRKKTFTPPPLNW